MRQQSILNPAESDFNHLKQIYSDSLSCPCTSISMNYSIFITLEPQYHQVCSSDLISTDWYNYYNSFDRDVVYPYADYRQIAAIYFKLLARLCQEIEKIIDDGLELLFEMKFISSEVISQSVFESEVNSSIRNWQLGTTERFLHTLQLVQSMYFGNQLASPSITPITLTIGDYVEVIYKAFSYGKNCSCALSSMCRSLMGIYNLSAISDTNIVLFYIPNFFTGCSPIESLFQSTLECFYNLSCMMNIDQHMYQPLGTSFNFSILDSTRNWPNETIQSIVNRMMIDSWKSNVSYSAYYNKCATQVCTFQYIGRNNIFSVVTTMIGIFGGLSLGIKLCLLVILRLVEKTRNNFTYLVWKIIIKNLFIFRTEYQLIRRFHFIVFVITLSIIYGLSASNLQSTTIIINKPSFSTYQDLTTHHFTSLQCSCSHISVKYQAFLTMIPHFHHICSSEFISDHWIEYIYDEDNLSSRFLPTDFRLSATSQFQLLASLCQLSRQTIAESLSQLMASDLVNEHLLSSSVLNERLRTTMDEFQFATSNSFLSIFNLMRGIIGANTIMPMLSTNWRFIPDRVPPHDQWTVHTKPLVYNECNCGLSWKCTQPSQGMMTGCYPIEALLQSTLQCFYVQECIDSTGIFQKLNHSLSTISRFHINTTIEVILNDLMVEEYLTNISYQSYFDECAPSSCTYTYISRPSTIEMITSLTGLYGGLVVITHSIAVIMAKLWFHRKRRIGPELVVQG